MTDEPSADALKRFLAEHDRPCTREDREACEVERYGDGPAITLPAMLGYLALAAVVLVIVLGPVLWR